MERNSHSASQSPSTILNIFFRFDSKRIVSGAYDGKIKVWDLQAAMDPRFEAQLCLVQPVINVFPKLSFAFLPIFIYLVLRAPAGTLCIRTLIEHSGRVFRLQFDEFQIVSSRFYTLIKQEIRLLNYIDVPRFSRTLILFSSHDDTILIWDFLNLSPPER